MNWLREFWHRWFVRPYRTTVRTGRTFVRLVKSVSANDTVLSIMHAEYRWRKARKQYIAYHQICAICGCKKELEVHHVRPWHLYPELRYDPKNFITLCDPCHFRFGHGLNYKNWNPQVREMAAAMQTYLSDIRAE